MSWIRYLALIIGLIVPVLLFTGCGAKRQPSWRAAALEPNRLRAALDPGVPPQAHPVIELVESCRTGQVRRFAAVASQRMHSRIPASEWPRQLEFYRSLFLRLTKNDFWPRGFTYRYDGDDASGLVHPSFGGRELPGFRVLFEDGRWVFDGR